MRIRVSASPGLSCLQEELRVFQRIAHARVDAIHSPPCLRDPNHRSIALSELEGFVGELVGFFNLHDAQINEHCLGMESLERGALVVTIERLDATPSCRGATPSLPSPTRTRRFMIQWDERVGCWRCGVLLSERLEASW